MTSLLDIALARVPLKKAAGTHGGEWQGPCPRCGGRDRFHVWPDRQSTGLCTVPGLWGCRVCDDSGDAIKFLQHMDGLSFKEACAKLGQELAPRHTPVKLPQPKERDKMEPVPDPPLPPAEWREKNARLVEHAHEALLQNPAELAWLAARGIGLEGVKRYKLGWLPGQPGSGKYKGELMSWYTRPLKAWGLPNEKLQDGSEKRTFKFPRGLVIPRFNSAGEVVGLRIRRPDYDRDPERGGSLPHLKYMAFKGGAVSPLVIMPDWLPQNAAGFISGLVGYCIQEAELDAMAAAEAARAAGLACGAVAMCSNSARPTETLHKILGAASCLLLGLDFDPEGSGGKKYTDKALSKWLAAYPRAKDWPVPQGKDVGEAYALGVNLALWLEAGLPPSLRPREPEAALPVPVAAPAPAAPPEPESAPVPTTPLPAPAEPPPALAALAAAFPDASLTMRGPLGPQLAELRAMLGDYPAAVFVKRPRGGCFMSFDLRYGSCLYDEARLEELRQKVLDSIALREWLAMHPGKQVHIRNFDQGASI